MNIVKPSNAKMDANKMINLLGLEGAGYIGGGTTDNATDALKETRETFNKVMEEFRKVMAEQLVSYLSSME